MSEEKVEILILEDDPDWAGRVLRVCEALDWKATHTSSVDSALRYLLKQNFDILVLDRLLSDNADGLALIPELHKFEITPLILVVSQLSITSEVVHGMETGADDYLSKPFDDAELRARLIALARRRGKWTLYPTVELIGDLEIRKAARTVTWKGESVGVPDKLFDLLWIFASNRGETLSLDRLWHEAWPEFSRIEPQKNSIEVAIGRLRKLLTELTGQQYIINIRGLGYRWEQR